MCFHCQTIICLKKWYAGTSVTWLKHYNYYIILTIYKNQIWRLALRINIISLYKEKLCSLHVVISLFLFFSKWTKLYHYYSKVRDKIHFAIKNRSIMSLSLKQVISLNRHTDPMWPFTHHTTYRRECKLILNILIISFLFVWLISSLKLSKREWRRQCIMR